MQTLLVRNDMEEEGSRSQEHFSVLTIKCVHPLDSESELMCSLSQMGLHSTHPFSAHYISVGPQLSGSEGIKLTDSGLSLQDTSLVLPTASVCF